MKEIVRGRGRETNIARGEYIRLETMPKCYFFHIAQAAVLLLVYCTGFNILLRRHISDV